MKLEIIVASINVWPLVCWKFQAHTDIKTIRVALELHCVSSIADEIESKSTRGQEHSLSVNRTDAEAG
jgi:hypothetical protein